MTRAAIWARVSTSEQETENQVAQLRAFAARRGLDVVKVYRVEESAWRGAHAKALTQVQNDGHRGQFSVLLVWALDRLSREGPAALIEIVNRLALRRVEVWSFQEPWTEAGGPMRELLLAIVAWVAQMESQRRSERTKAGLARALAQGKRLGRPPGKRDGKQRKKSGYHRRWSVEREKVTGA